MWSGRVAVDEAVAHESSLYVGNGSPHSGLCRRQQDDQRQHQQARIRVLRAVVLDERIQSGIETLATDVLMDLTAEMPPSGRFALQAELFNALDGAIHRDPRHHF